MKISASSALLPPALSFRQCHDQTIHHNRPQTLNMSTFTTSTPCIFTIPPASLSFIHTSLLSCFKYRPFLFSLVQTSNSPDSLPPNSYSLQITMSSANIMVHGDSCLSVCTPNFNHTGQFSWYTEFEERNWKSAVPRNLISCYVMPLYYSEKQTTRLS